MQFCSFCSWIGLTSNSSPMILHGPVSVFCATLQDHCSFVSKQHRKLLRKFKNMLFPKCITFDYCFEWPLDCIFAFSNYCYFSICAIVYFFPLMSPSLHLLSTKSPFLSLFIWWFGRLFCVLLSETLYIMVRVKYRTPAYCLQKITSSCNFVSFIYLV